MFKKRLIKLSSLLLLFLFSTVINAQTDLLFKAQSLCNEKKFEEAIPMIDKVVLNPETAKDPASWHIRAFAYLQQYKTLGSANTTNLHLLDTVVFSAHRSLRLDANTDYRENNEAFIKNIAATYYKLCVTSLQDYFDHIKSEDFYLKYKKYTSFVNPIFDFKEKDIQYYNTKGTIFLDLGIKNNLNAKYLDIGKSAVLKVLEMDSTNQSAIINLRVIQEKLNLALEKKINTLLEKERLRVTEENAEEIFVRDVEIHTLNDDKKLTNQELKNQKAENDKKAQELTLIAKQKKLQEIEIQQQNRTRNLILIGLFLVVCFSIFVFISLQKNKKSKKIIELQKNEVEKQKHLLEEKNQEITDSINYAQRIQNSLLASTDLLNSNLSDYFIYFQPKDIVSGDFYWGTQLPDNKFILVTADSTGHGVPGAIMSMLNISCLNEAVDHIKLTEPADILDHVRKTVIKTLANDGSTEGGKDGMDCSLMSFDFTKRTLTYSAANNPIWIIRNNSQPELIELTADRMPVGKHHKDTISFSQHAVNLQKGDIVYSFTDGYADQFGGPKGKKFMYKKLKELLISISTKSLTEQGSMLENHFINWKKETEQVDDITVIGIKVS